MFIWLFQNSKCWKKFSCRVCRILRHLIPFPSYRHQTGSSSDGSFFRHVTGKLGTDFKRIWKERWTEQIIVTYLSSLCHESYPDSHVLSSSNKQYHITKHHCIPCISLFGPVLYIQRSTGNVQTSGFRTLGLTKMWCQVSLRENWWSPTCHHWPSSAGTSTNRHNKGQKTCRSTCHMRLHAT